MRAFLVEEDAQGFRAGVADATPEPSGPDDVLVEVDFSGVNFKDSLVARPGSRVRRAARVVGGVDAAGTVVAVARSGLPRGRRSRRPRRRPRRRARRRLRRDGLRPGPLPQRPAGQALDARRDDGGHRGLHRDGQRPRPRVPRARPRRPGPRHRGHRRGRLDGGDVPRRPRLRRHRLDRVAGRGRVAPRARRRARDLAHRGGGPRRAGPGERALGRRRRLHRRRSPSPRSCAR